MMLLIACVVAVMFPDVSGVGGRCEEIQRCHGKVVVVV